MGQECFTWRPTIRETMMATAALWSSRSTCLRRGVGCVIADEQNHILAVGYNGVAKGLTHCTDVACPGAKSESGTDLDKCEAIHAEANALIQCLDLSKIHTIYCTTMPCMSCTKMLLNTPCKVIVYDERYPHDADTVRLWEMTGREVVRYVTQA